MKLRQLAEQHCLVTLMLTALLVISTRTFAQGGNNTVDPILAAEAEQAIRNFSDAISRGDGTQIDSFIANDGFAYDSAVGYVSAKTFKSSWTYILTLVKSGSKYSYEFSDFKFAATGGDGVVANYLLLITDSSTGTPEKLTLRVTDVLVKRAGKWQLLVEHTSTVPTPAEQIIAGLPTGWRRNTSAAANNYLITVDTATKHSGGSSASIKFGCGDSSDSWAALTQSIAADDYRGKRIRLSGWLKTADAAGASLWMRVDGERDTLAFDNMDNRLISGTTDWKPYTIVLDVPLEAKNIFVGVLSRGRGQTWADDLKLDVVDNNVAHTNIGTPYGKEDQTSIAKTPKATNKHPVNLGFEEGVVP